MSPAAMPGDAARNRLAFVETGERNAGGELIVRRSLK